MSGRIYANVLGLLQKDPPLVKVIPLSGRYIPKARDVVVGTVTDVQGTFWLLDIGAPRWAPLHMTGTPWKIDFGETEQYLHVGDAVVVAVESIEATGRIGVTMNGEGLGKLEGGTIVRISPAKVPRVIGRSGSMIHLITQRTETRMVVGQNGRVWIDGPEDGVRRVEECLRLIDEEGHRSGLTERVEALLRDGEPKGSSGHHTAFPSDLPHVHGERRRAPSDRDVLDEPRVPAEKDENVESNEFGAPPDDDVGPQEPE